LENSLRLRRIADLLLKFDRIIFIKVKMGWINKDAPFTVLLKAALAASLARYLPYSFLSISFYPLD
jgi:hypothetical protein